MKNQSGTEARQWSGRYWCFTLTAGGVFLGAVTLPLPVAAGETDRSGREVVQAICGACHDTGTDGAPKIGDKNAWGKLSARGLTSLTQTALAGFRKMPPHGGSADTSDLDISRAITFMINQSGGNWTEPAGKSAPAAKVAAQAGG